MNMKKMKTKPSLPILLIYVILLYVVHTSTIYSQKIKSFLSTIDPSLLQGIGSAIIAIYIPIIIIALSNIYIEIKTMNLKI